tara:strand:- start:24 stop:1712 length:1689 start_codon:yes stop_codon:yes gene_type:complete
MNTGRTQVKTTGWEQVRDAYATSKSKNSARYKAATVLLKENIFKTLEDTHEVLLYRNGIYEHGGENHIQKTLQQKLRSLLSNHDVKEIVETVRRSTLTSREDFDKEPFLIACENQTVNTLTGEVLTHSADHLLTAKIPVQYVKDAKCPKFLKFLKEIVSEDDAERLQEMVGYCLLKDYRYQIAFMLVGEGSNGKSTLLIMVTQILGATNVSAVQLQELSQNRFAKATLYKKLANICNDLGKKAMTETGSFKMATGNDPITAEFKNQNAFTFRSYAKMLFACNEVPEAYDDTDGFYRRWIIINFPNKFTDDGSEGTTKKNANLGVELLEEASGVLNWAIAGLKRLNDRGGFNSNRNVEETRETYQRMSSPVAAFAKDWLIIDVKGWIDREELYSTFQKYCSDNKLSPCSKTKVGYNLGRFVPVSDQKRTIGKKRSTGWAGIRWEEGVLPVRDVKDGTLFSPPSLKTPNSRPALGNKYAKPDSHDTKPSKKQQQVETNPAKPDSRDINPHKPSDVVLYVHEHPENNLEHIESEFNKLVVQELTKKGQLIRDKDTYRLPAEGATA